METLTTPTGRGTVRMIGLIVAKDGMTHEEFTERWLRHGELIRSMDYVQKNILKYEQYHLDTSIPAEHRASLVECSGMAIMEADSLDKILGIFTSKEFLAKGVVDEETFLNREKSRMYPAFTLTVLDNDRPTVGSEKASH
ncbi:hypothetical protein EXIGLDRAFT_836705 [Exidia glandulosa HHB12029]|uniref:EthD domain-containing protein n=1 Tax=Exidia glandulosa HHB12029 TaxID=1314781 RepID=A0A165HL62_EXIGL|nr:hypothetical protein EXIGLDRAFT_836705 [Exidia glandulosa HHB12029]